MAAKIALIILIICIVKVRTKFEGFIVGGEFAKIEDFPYSVFISKICSNTSATCGASILTQSMLLTAGHCVFKCQKSFLISAYTGSEKKYEGFETKVISFKLHQDYDNVTKANDIAVMRLQNDLKFGTKVKRVALVSKPPKCNIAVIAGWGWIDSVGTRGDYLKHAHQYIIDQNTCSGMLGSTPLGTICGKDVKNYPEKGDSGSALIVNDFIQIGVVSFKRREYTNDTIVYTDVSYFYDWIMEAVRELSCDDDKDSSISPTTSPATPKDKNVECLLGQRRSV